VQGPVWAQLGLCPEPAETAVTAGQAAGLGQLLGHSSEVTELLTPLCCFGIAQPGQVERNSSVLCLQHSLCLKD